MARHGVFVENRLRKLVETGEVDSQVIAPVPWFPFSMSLFGQYANFARVKDSECRHGINIMHPRYLMIPKIGMNLTPYLMKVSLLRKFKRLIANGYDFDLIDAHYFYPDGVAAAEIATKLGKPFVITARGTDINFIPRYKKPRQMILQAAEKASAIITVCNALKTALVKMGADENKIIVLRNGVDLDMFIPPSNRDQLREALGFKRKTILSVGHLIERKGHDLVIQALSYLKDVELYIAGDGPEENHLKNLSRDLGVSSRVHFLGAIKHDELKNYYGAADVLVLASSREGWANVLLESMACGTPVVATNIWGTPEVVSCDEAGVLVERTAESIANGIKQIIQHYPDRNMTRNYAEKFGWESTTRGQLKLFRRIIQESHI